MKSLLIVCALLFSTAALAQGDRPDPVGATRTALEKWVETNAQISKETRDWAVAKDALAASIDVAKREIVSTQKRIGEAGTDIAAADRKRAELVAENDREKAAGAALEQRIVALEQRVQQLLPRLPDALRDKLEPLTQLLPAADAGELPPIGNRYATVVGVIDALHKWNREITVTSEVRALPDGTSVEVAVLYVGLGQAFYVSGNGKVAGSGAATADRWVWRAAHEIAPGVQRAVAVFKNEQPAVFVPLPVQIQ